MHYLSNNKHLKNGLALLGVGLGMAVLAAGSGCALDDGDPWGQAHFELTADFDPSSRVQDDRIMTARNYAIELDRIEVGFSTLSLDLSTEGSGPVSFDPADPPEGFSLCHNGHCHDDSGGLPTYEEIEADLAESEATAGGVIMGIERSIAVEGRTPITLGECSNECRLERGRLSLVQLSLASIRLSGRAFDTTAQERLPDDGERFDFSVPLETNFTEVVDGLVGRGEPVDVDLETELELSVKTLDSIDFGAFGSEPSSIDAATADAIEASLSEDSVFDVFVSREN